MVPAALAKISQIRFKSFVFQELDLRFKETVYDGVYDARLRCVSLLVKQIDT